MTAASSILRKQDMRAVSARETVTTMPAAHTMQDDVKAPRAQHQQQKGVVQ